MVDYAIVSTASVPIRVNIHSNFHGLNATWVDAVEPISVVLNQNGEYARLVLKVVLGASGGAINVGFDSSTP